jgi:hypothetical protein
MWHPPVKIDIQHDIFDVISLSINVILGLAAIASLWFSRKALKKSEFDSAMSTSPSIVIRPRSIWVGTRNSAIEHGYGVCEPGRVVSKEVFEVNFHIEFECFNAGRGVAFNISQPKVEGLGLSDFRDSKTPLYLTLGDNPFELAIMRKAKFADFYADSDKEIPTSISITYTNDQNNIFCRSTWKANIRPVEQDGENLKVREIRLLQRSGRIEYSQTPFV